MIEIRPSWPQDFDGYYKCFNQCAAESKNYSFINPVGRVGVEQFFNRLISGSGVHITADEHGKCIGWCDVYKAPDQCKSHLGSLSIGVLASHRGMGVGRELLRMALECAAEKGIWRITLEVLTDNVGAIALYKSQGFQIEGCKVAEWHHAGVSRDFWIMARIQQPTVSRD